jgi:hypothetical protein
MPADNGKDSGKPNSKKRLATFLVVIIILLAIFATFAYKPSPAEEKEEPEEEPFTFEFLNYPASRSDLDNNEPTVAINPTDHNNIVAAANDYNTPTGVPWCGFYTSFDGGETWTESMVPGFPGDSGIHELTGFEGSGDPVLAVTSSGVFYMAGIAFKRAGNPLNPIGFGFNLGRSSCVFVARSTDNGQSFDDVTIVFTALQSLITFHDKEWLAVDPNNGNVYLCWAMFHVMALSQLAFSRSTDDGATWSDRQIISEFESAEMQIQGSAITVDNSGNVHVTWIDFSQNQVRYTVSSNQGQSFANPVNVAPIDPIPRYLENGNYRTPTMTMLAVDTSDTNLSGSLYVTWADISHGDSDVFLAYSNDNGNSWTGPVRVNNDTEGNGIDQFFPAVAVSADGLVHVTFYDRRNDVNNTLLEYWWAISFDGGQTFPVNLQISDATFNGDYSRNGDNDFIGDYTGVVATNESVAAVWCDTREGSEEDADSEIYFVNIAYLEVLEQLEIENLENV